MSLKIWFPFNGNLTSNGIQNPTITNIITPGFSIGGKIGNCWTSGEIAIDSATTAASFADNNTSVAFWFNNNGSMTGDCAICGTSGNGYGGSTRTWDFFNYPSKNDFHWSMTDMGNGVLYGVLADNVWNHIAITKDSTTLRIYINGVLQHTASSSNPGYSYAVNYYIGASGTNYKLNDFRVYNHCLSVAEIKELNKGLVVHYPLNNGYAEPTTNICNGSDCGAVGTSTWGKVTYYATLKNRTTEPVPTNTVTEFVLKQNGSSEWGGGAVYPSAGSFAVSPSTTYCYSKYIKASDNFVHVPHVNMLYRYEYTSSGSYVTEAGCFSTERLIPIGDGWYRCWGLFTTSSTTGRVTLPSYTYPDGYDVTYWLAGIQLEAKDHITPYVPSTRTNISIYDVSGYKNNAELCGENLPTVLSTSPRYDKCTYINSLNAGTHTYTGCSYIKGTLNSQIVNPTALTISWWSNMESWSYQDSGILSLSNNSSGPGDYTESTLNQYDSMFRVNMTNGNANALSATDLIQNNAWHHYVIVIDGTVAKSYRDGSLIQTLSTSGTVCSFQYVYLGWSFAGGCYRFTKGKWSDFRVYTTALTQSDITDLYNAPIKIASDGALITNGEVVE